MFVSPKNSFLFFRDAFSGRRDVLEIQALSTLSILVQAAEGLSEFSLYKMTLNKLVIWFDVGN